MEADGELFQTEMDFGAINETFSRDVYQRCASVCAACIVCSCAAQNSTAAPAGRHGACMKGCFRMLPPPALPQLPFCQHAKQLCNDAHLAALLPLGWPQVRCF